MSHSTTYTMTLVACCCVRAFIPRDVIAVRRRRHCLKPVVLRAPSRIFMISLRAMHILLANEWRDTICYPLNIASSISYTRGIYKQSGSCTQTDDGSCDMSFRDFSWPFLLIWGARFSQVPREKYEKISLAFMKTILCSFRSAEINNRSLRTAACETLTDRVYHKLQTPSTIQS